MLSARLSSACAVLLLVQACSHPIEITGEGDVMSTSGDRNCLLDDYLNAADNCTVNLVVDDYEETYIGEPRAGWIFDRWGNYCTDADDNRCSFSVPAAAVRKYWGDSVAPLQAVFSRYKVTGPIMPGGSFINLGTGDPLAQGYAEQEFFIAGSAVSYTPDLPLPADGTLSLNPNPDTTDGDYRTRFVVLRPLDRASFNGTVVVEWLNVTAGADTAQEWTYAHNEYVRSGYAYVGVSAQARGVENLLSGARYASLVHPGDSYSYDIFSDVGRFLRENGAQVLGGVAPQRLIAAGESQSASRMVTYINGVHPLEPIFDGFMVHSRGSRGADISQAPLPEYGYETTVPIRSDLAVPVMVVQAEDDVVRSVGVRQPDTPLFRLWEMAGATHADAYLFGGTSDIGDGEGAKRMFELMRAPNNPLNCERNINAGPHHWIMQAAYDGLDTWIRSLEQPAGTNTPPASGTPLTLASTDPLVLARDAVGNALGGIRSPHVDAPVAILDSVNGPGENGFGFCFLFGSTTPLTPEEILQIYPTQEDFLKRWNAAITTNVMNGFLLQADTRELIDAARAWDFPN